MVTHIQKLDKFYGSTVELHWQPNDNLFMKSFVYTWLWFEMTACNRNGAEVRKTILR